MKIGIDGNEANLHKRVGVNNYAFNLLHALKKISQNTNNNKFYIYLKDEPHSQMPKPGKNWEYKILAAKKMWIITRLSPYLRKNPDKVDVFFTPSHYIPPFVKIKRVASIMDLGYLESKGQFKKYDYWQLKYWTAYSIRKASKLLAISIQTERDIVRHYSTAAMKTYVTHLSHDSEMFNQRKSRKDIERVKQKFNIGKNYILFIGTLKPSKNIDGLIKAWKSLEKKYSDVDLVIAGKKGWLYESIFDLVKLKKLESRVIFTDFVQEDEKLHLIKGAKAFLLPSFWEGFGIDVLSSMASGVPVIISKVGSLPEVGGEAAVYVDPYDIEGISKAIDKVLSMDSKEYKNLVRLGVEQSQKFSWDKTARHTLEVIKSV